MSFNLTTYTSIIDLFNEMEQQPDPAARLAADHYLLLALQSSEHRFEALLSRALREIKSSNWAQACIDLSNALRLHPHHEKTQALLAKSISAIDPQAALEWIDVCLDDFPESKILWPLYWMIAGKVVEQSTTQLTAQRAEPRFLQEALARLPEVVNGTELSLIFQLLGKLDDSPQRVGVCHVDPKTMLVTGWALDRAAPQVKCELLIEGGTVRGRLYANAPSERLRSAGFAVDHGGFQIKLAQPLESLHLSFSDGTPLIGSPLSALAALPIHVPHETPMKKSNACVDVLIPVFGGREQTLECIRSVLSARGQNKTRHEMIVLDDASPDVELSRALVSLAQDGLITLHRRPANLGFIRNMNRAMLLHRDRDVVWLNADTRVTGDWLDRLQRNAYADATIASVTPLSNNAELASFPEIRVSSPMPDEVQQQALDQLMAELNLPPQEIFVGCGFCFYLKRTALEDVGLLDELTLSRGYGEETDWCLRALSQGWHHVVATNVFVAHAGGKSFGRAKRSLVKHNNAIIKARYPLASEAFDRFVQADPLQSARQSIQRARLEQRAVGVGRVLRVVPEHSPQRVDGDELKGSACVDLSWTGVGDELTVQLCVSDVCPALVMLYHLPHARVALQHDLASFAPTGYAVFGDENLPSVLAHCLKPFKRMRTPVLPRRSMHHKGDSIPALGKVGLMIDDLSDPVVAQRWLTLPLHIKAGAPSPQAPTTFRLLALQDVAAVAQLEKMLQVILVNIPKGFSTERWLKIVGVSFLVSAHEPDRPEFMAALDVFFKRFPGCTEFENLQSLSIESWMDVRETGLSFEGVV